jgi:hypothetical protein
MRRKNFERHDASNLPDRRWQQLTEEGRQLQVYAEELARPDVALLARLQRGARGPRFPL